MSERTWLSDVNDNIVYKFEAEDGSTVLGTSKQLAGLSGSPVEGEPGEVITIDGVEFSYAGFKPIKLNQRSEVAFEKNGRKAVAIRDKDGSMRYVSETKRHFQKTGQIKQQFSRAMEVEIEKSVQRELQAAQYHKKNKQSDPMSEAIKKLSDGEYVSDGKTFIRADEHEEQVKLVAKSTKE
jgi:hypothetical protein